MSGHARDTITTNPLRAARLNAGFAQPEDLAVATGLSERTIRRLEGGQRPRSTTAIRLANALGVKALDLFPELAGPRKVAA